MTIQDRVCAEIVEKKSRFIACVAPVTTEEEAVAFIDEIRCAHRLARHNVYAYVLREGGRMRYSDDGEPAKTAGLPTLDTIRHAGLTDVAVVVTRYFGGTLLGTGGLVRAYTQATQAALDAAETVCFSACVAIKVTVAYAWYESVKRSVDADEAKVIDEVFCDEVVLTYLVKEDAVASFEACVSEITSGHGVLETGTLHFAAF